ncbi:MAG: hypothetical protein ABEK00_00975 [Candidatus Nanohaloarchaea archaeon]
MNSRKIGISILFLVVIASGCMDNTSTDSQSGKAIQVKGPEVSPSSGRIFEGSTVRVSMGVKNTGEMNGTLTVGDRGSQILTNYCPDMFKIIRYDAQSSKTSAEHKTYFLKPGWEASFEWELKHIGDVGILKDKCTLNFQAPFNYSVEAYKQLQIKKNAEAGGDPSLSSKSSKGPLAIQIETIGSSSDQGAPVFIEGDSIELFVRFSKKTRKESPYRGLLDISNIDLSATGISINRSSCKIPDQIIMSEGDSQIIRCDLEYGGSIDVPSITPQVTVKADYQFVKDAGSRTVVVRSGGN